MVPCLLRETDVSVGPLPLAERPVEMGALVTLHTGRLKFLGQGGGKTYRHLRNHNEFRVIVDVGKS